eukprot:NODE_102_length_1455_cov_557.566856_g80_i0.p1 GENE.NODE_102_length_1455_cov_557.566856_g80_i0~~NODE_102_length_1455_cov_557.566856_g80_i0.p1  ORF type:complete len:376 (-),score=60.07 NODE_102_length_1455_cov_557.566856_g80_i0:216-1343(-)
MAEVLTRITRLLKDYLGVLTEESLRKNFVLVYEILDEVIDFGYPQETSTEKLKAYIFNEPEHVEPPPSDVERLKSKVAQGAAKLGSSLQWHVQATKKNKDSHVSIIERGGGRKNEIFVDVLEKLNVAFNSTGAVIMSEIDGAIIMKSFLAGSPELRLGLNEDLVVGKTDSRRGYSTVVLDDCNFHETVDYRDFEVDRTLTFRPPDGEFTVLNYRVTSEFTLPFRVFPFIEQLGPYKLEVTLKIRADIPTTTHAANVLVRFNVPKTTTGVTVEFGVGATGQSYEYRQTDKLVCWGIRKFTGGTEQMCKARISLSNPIGGNIRKEIGPVAMQFEIPMHNVSKLAIRFLRIEERSKSYNPSRWVRNITQASSYVCRIV